MQSFEALLKAKAPGAVSSEIPTPLYFQVYSLLKGLITDGTIPFGQKMPAEEVLAGIFNVSRITAKRSMDELAQEGFIERRRGRGSHVVYQYRAKPVRAPMVGVLEEIERVAGLSEAHVLECVLAAPPMKVREQLAVNEDGAALHLVRVRESEGRKFGYYSSWTAWHAVPENPDVFKTIPRLQYFKERGFEVNYVTQTISATTATAELAKALDVPEGAALLHLVRRSFLREGEQTILKDYLNVYYNPDYFQYEMAMSLS